MSSSASGRTRLPWRICAALAVFQSCFGLSGCTYLMWTKHGPWPPARNEYVAIEAVADSDEELFVRVRRSHSGTETWKFRLLLPKSSMADWEIQDACQVADEECPTESAHGILIVPGGEIPRKERPGPHLDAWLALSLSTTYESFDHFDITPSLVLIDPRWPYNHGRVDLYYPEIAWTTGNVLGHFLLTPPAIAFDAAFWPFELLIAILAAALHGH